MPYKRGAPAGNANRLKDGRYCAVSIAQRKRVRTTIRSARRVLLQALLEVSDMDPAGCPRMDKST